MWNSSGSHLTAVLYVKVMGTYVFVRFCCAIACWKIPWVCKTQGMNSRIIDVILFFGLFPSGNFDAARRFGSRLWFPLQAMKTHTLVDPLDRAVPSHWTYQSRCFPCLVLSSETSHQKLYDKQSPKKKYFVSESCTIDLKQLGVFTMGNTLRYTTFDGRGPGHNSLIVCEDSLLSPSLWVRASSRRLSVGNTCSHCDRRS